MQPNPLESKDFTISDVACGTGGFLVNSYKWHKRENEQIPLTSEQKLQITNNTYFGNELVQKTHRLALMNLFLLGLQPNIELTDTIYSPKAKQTFDCILANPPFGNKGVSKPPQRTDFLIKTKSKQLNFVQHIISVLKRKGRAGIVLPDSCLIDRNFCKFWAFLMQYHNVHTILKLPNGTFSPYAAGVKTCVIFLEKGTPTSNTWIYDARTNVENITQRLRPLSSSHFKDFVKCYGENPNGTGNRIELERFKCFAIDKIKANNYRLDFVWIEMETNDKLAHLTTLDEVIEYTLEEVMGMAEGLRELLEMHPK